MGNHDTLNPRQRIPPINGHKDDRRSPTSPSQSRTPYSRTNDDRDDDDDRQKKQQQPSRNDRVSLSSH